MASTVIVAGALFPYNPLSMEGLKKLHFRPYNGNGGYRGNVKTALASPASARACRLMVRAEAINPGIRKEEAKVVDSVVASELAKPVTAYCRCWRSGTFPLCDGSHVKHNKETGDNVGPLLLKKQ